MKRILSLILVLVMALPIFASCKKKNSPPSTSTSASQNSQSSVTPGTSTPGTSTPGTSTPGASTPGTSTPGTSTPGASTPESSEEIGGGSQTTTTGFNYEDYREVNSDYNRNLFYYNELKFEVADPTVIYIEDKNSPEYGYFYAYGTSDQIGCHGFQAWRSKDMTNWEDMGPVFLPDFNNNWSYTNYWAPEIIYDAQGMNIGGETYKYFMFYNAETYDPNQNYISDPNRPEGILAISVLYAKEPNGPFIHPNGITNSDGESLSVSAPVFNFNLSNKISNGGKIADEFACKAVLDASPFVDEDGQKYLYYSGHGAYRLCPDGRNGSNAQCIYGVKMKDWLTPDYSTISLVAQTHRNTVDGELVDHEGRLENAWVNEGPFVVKKNGTYMLTFSVYDWKNPNYQVRLATSTTGPLSGFTKIDPSNGGTVIKSSADWNGVVSSVGHHSFITIGDELYIAYHTFKNRVSYEDGRALAIDKVEFVNHDGKEILFTNGPTYGLQALPAEVSGYKNVAKEATITATRVRSDSPDISYLTDGLIQYLDPVVIGEITKDVYFNRSGNPTITIDFGNEYKNVRSIMIHFSREWSRRVAKQGITKTTITYKSTSGDKQVVVDDWQYDYDKYNKDMAQKTYPGGAAILEFAELPVKKIEIEIAGNESTNNFKIAEVMVFANKNNTTITPVSDAQIASKYTYTNAEVPEIIKAYESETFGDTLANGVKLSTTYGVDLSKDNATDKEIRTIGPRDQFAYFKNVSGDVVYFEGKISVYTTNAFLGDPYPKLGLVAKNEEGATFFYIDAANSYSNQAVGYTQSKFGSGEWDWENTEAVKTAAGIQYKNGNFAKLAIARVDNNFYFFYDDMLMFESPELRGMLDDKDAAYGFSCFNSGMIIKDYACITDRTAVLAKIEEYKANVPTAVNGSEFGSLEGNPQVQSGTTWDVSMDYTKDNHQYANRKVTLSKSDGMDNYLFFKNEGSNNLYLEADFKVTGIISPDAFAKFGIMFRTLDSANKANGIFFYADARTGDNTKTEVADITGRTFGYATRLSDAWSWDISMGGQFDPTATHTLAVYREGDIFKFIVDGVVVFETAFYLGGTVYPAIFSFNVGLEVTNYRITSDTTDEKMQLYKVQASEPSDPSSLTFGTVSASAIQKGTWTTSTGAGTSTASGESVTWAKGITGNNYYFEAKVKAGNPINNDQWPKVGLAIRSENKELFFAINALNTGSYGANNFVTYAIRTGTGGHEFKTEVPVAGLLYTNGNGATMGIWINEGKEICLIVNGLVVFRIDELADLLGDSINTYVGVMGWGMQFSFENAIAITDETELAALSETYGITDTASGITVDGDTSDWTGTKANYYEAKETTGDRGFKVSAVMGTKGVYVLYQGVSQTIGKTNAQWWQNLNVEMIFRTSTDARKDAKVNINGFGDNAYISSFNTSPRQDGLYDIVVEVFVPYSTIGYTGAEDFVAGFFAFRPNDNEVATGINGGNNGNWWFGTVHPHETLYASAETTYKITSAGLVGPSVTTVVE